ncbi:hypothetical protein [Streptomyces xinghaiensis]|uniref:hypothetical protein n=1 Tax=Streptomyces xinghaiensis TaxID=1038928 RepID=UPI002E0E52A0|nr:hypothetical protein OG463_15115 [Streptomyces xinghaiensis]
MIVEAAGTLIGFTAAFSVPTGFGWHSKRPWHAIAFTLIYGVFVVTPSGITLKEAVAAACITTTSACFALLRKPASWKFPHFGLAWQNIKSKLIDPPQPTKVEYTAATAGIISILLPIFLGLDAGVSLVRRGITEDDRFIVVTSGLLIAVFGCQQLIGTIVRPLVKKILERIENGDFDENVGSFIKAGPHVGWIERFILFSFLISGNPAAAALVVTAKSLARFPEIQQAEKLVGDYYLVGTLTSVAVALATSSITRLALGMPPL